MQSFVFNTSREDEFHITYVSASMSPVLTVVGSMDATVVAQYYVQLTANDTYAFGALTASATAVVNVVLVNTPPVFANSSASVQSGEILCLSPINGCD